MECYQFINSNNGWWNRQKKINQKLVLFTKFEYFNLRNLAWQFLLNNNIKELPINLKLIAQQNNWLLLPYNKAQRLIELTNNKLYTKTCLGFTSVINNKYFIFYDDTILKEIQNFTIAHEFGHIALLHLHNIIGYKKYEKEANMFSIRILAPACVLKELKVKNEQDVAHLCAISLKSAKYRFDRLAKLKKRNKFYTNNLEKKVLKNFKLFIKNYKGYI